MTQNPAPKNILIVQESLSKNIIEKVESLKDSSFFKIRLPSDEVVEEIKSNKVDVAVIEWSGSSAIMREFLEDLQKYKSNTPLIALLSQTSSAGQLDPVLKNIDLILKPPVNEEMLNFTISQLALPIEKRWSRKTPRAKVKISIELSNLSRSKFLLGEVGNLSTGGMFVELPDGMDTFNRGDEIYFQASDQAFGSLNGKGTIRWIRNDGLFGIGIQFNSIDPSMVEKMSEYIDKEL